MQIRPFVIADTAAVIELWRACDLLRPQNDPHKDMLRKAAVQPELFMVAELDGEIVGTVMAGYEGHRGWINYLAVSPAKQRSGIGRALMNQAEQKLRALGCPKINLQVRVGNEKTLAFYRAIGFAIDNVVSMGKRLEKD